MTHEELIHNIKVAHIKRMLSRPAVRKMKTAQTPAIFGTINKRIAAAYGIELADGSTIQYR